MYPWFANTYISNILSGDWVETPLLQPYGSKVAVPEMTTGF